MTFLPPSQPKDPDMSDTDLPLALQTQQLVKRYGKKTVLQGIDLSIPQGRVVGLIGPNGSGKTTTLKALLGLASFEGEIFIHGKDPRKHHAQLMEDVAFIADVALLPKWITTQQALDFVEGVHPRFDRSKAERYLQKTSLSKTQKVGQMSKGMIVQLHLALILAIDAKLLVLDEPTLGLDVLYRKQFYQSLIEDYFDDSKTILITTHQVEEVEHLLTDVIFLQQGQVVLNASIEDVQRRFVQVKVKPERLDEARALRPLDEQNLFGQKQMLFDGAPLETLETLGVVHPARLSDIFVALMKGTYA